MGRWLSLIKTRSQDGIVQQCDHLKAKQRLAVILNPSRVASI